MNPSRPFHSKTSRGARFEVSSALEQGAKPRQIVFGRFSRGRGFGVGDLTGSLAGRWRREAPDCSSCHYYSAFPPTPSGLLKLARQKPIKVLARLISAFLAGKRGISKREGCEVWGIIYIIIESEQWGHYNCAIGRRHLSLMRSLH